MLSQPGKALAATLGSIAVLMWSLKPIYVGSLSGNLSPAEIFFWAGVIAFCASAAGLLHLRRDMRKLYLSGSCWRVVRASSISGAFLSIWYLCFYTALSGHSSVEATVISFTWPLVAVMATRLVAPDLQRRIRVWEYPFLGLAFLGACVTATGVSGETGVIFFAALAALGSGLYLPFALRAMSDLTRILGSRMRASFIAISIANTASLIIAIPALSMLGVDAIPNVVPSSGELVLLALIGLGTYLLAEMLWCSAALIAASPGIAALPYFSPALSVLFLALFRGSDVPATAVAGLLMVLAANLSLHFDLASHWRRRSRTSPEAVQ